MASPWPSAARIEAVAPEEILVHFTGRKVRLDEATTYSIREQLLAMAEEPTSSRLFLDFGNVDYLSSMALATFVSFHKKLRAAGRHLTIYQLSPQVHKVFTVTGLDKLLDLRLQGLQKPATAAAWGQAAAPGGVLVVDDEAMIREVLKTHLRGAGFEVWLAAHGPQAIECYRQHRPALAVVLLDVLMPDSDGPQTLTALQKLNPAVLCCFMTGNPWPYTETSLIQMGAVRVFQKPFRFTEVFDTLHLLLSLDAWCRQNRWIEIPLSRSVNDVGT